MMIICAHEQHALKKNWKSHHFPQNIPDYMLRGEQKRFKLAQVEVYIQLKAEGKTALKKLNVPQ